MKRVWSHLIARHTLCSLWSENDRCSKSWWVLFACLFVMLSVVVVLGSQGECICIPPYVCDSLNKFQETGFFLPVNPWDQTLVPLPPAACGLSNSAVI